MVASPLVVCTCTHKQGANAWEAEARDEIATWPISIALGLFYNTCFLSWMFGIPVQGRAVESRLDGKGDVTGLVLAVCPFGLLGSGQ